MRNGWEVIQTYENEGNGPFIVDLSHIPKWDLQGEDLSKRRPAGISVPSHSGYCRLEKGMLINVVKWNWAVIWCFAENPSAFFQEPAFTDVTEAYALLLILGKNVFSVMEKVSALDLVAPSKKRSFLTIGPVLHIRSQVVVMGNDSPGIFVACPRGYGHAMADGLLEAGEEYGLCPAGEKRASEWWHQCTHND
jgi:hypothetical protein